MDKMNLLLFTSLPLLLTLHPLAWALVGMVVLAASVRFAWWLLH